MAHACGGKIGDIGDGAVYRSDQQQCGGPVDVSHRSGTASLDTSIVPFAMAIMMAASAEFSTPIGYQTNLMVRPGGYRFSDYLRIGLPLNGVVGCVSLGMILWLYF